ncbi:S8 family serine peptidase [Atopobium fossor]|uniref:S8 family serine peptidase n=1 Tax=Atopobium fossor TaxID=39487 RepID=UPI000400FA0D|nr:S8 family serine peptidase [Atopobium fossor]
MRKRSLLAFFMSAVLLINSMGVPLAQALPSQSTRVDASQSTPDGKKQSTEQENYPILREFIDNSRVDLFSNKEKTRIRLVAECKPGKLSELRDELNKIPTVQICREYTTILQGFSFDIAPEHMEYVQSLACVQKVELSRPIEPQMINAKELSGVIEARKKHAERYGNLDGRGMVIATIDSGVDITSPEMRLDDDAKASAKIKDFDHEHFTEKIPWGFNYMSGDTNLIDDNAKPHGMHIAGILAGNPKDDKGTEGVAPNAQLLAYKVFTDAPVTHEEEREFVGDDAVFDAMDDAVEHGADIISLSVGKPGSGMDGDIWSEVVERTTKKNVVIVAAVGNYASSGSTNTDDKYSDNELGVRDSSTMVSVAAHPKVIGVGSAYNTAITTKPLTIDGTEYPMGSVNRHNDKYIPSQEVSFPLVYAGTGMEKDIADREDLKDLTGKVVILVRGGESLKTKINRFTTRKAAGVVVLNAPAGLSLGNFDTHPIIGYEHFDITGHAWVVSVPSTAQDHLRAKAEKGETCTFLFGADDKLFEVKDATGISGFSSVGPGANLSIKPDLVAPGEDILSTGNHGSHVIMSGTSMSSPHVAGMATVLAQRVKELNGASKLTNVDLTKTLLMNTSAPLIDRELKEASGTELYYSVRRQGAGLANLDRALATEVIATCENKPAAELHEIGQTTDFVITLHNLGKTTQSFTIDKGTPLGERLIDRERENEGNTFTSHVMHEYRIDGASLTGDDSVEIAAGGMAQIKLHLDTGQAQDEFVEGYVRLISSNSNQPDLTIPYMGFKGDWGKEDVLDRPQWEQGNKTGLVTLYNEQPGDDHDTRNYLPLGRMTGATVSDPQLFALSTAGINAGSTCIRNVVPLLVFLRTAEDYEIAVVKEEKEDAPAIRTLRHGHFGTKYFESEARYYDGNGYNVPDPLGKWEGKVYDPKTNDFVTVSDGQYYFRIKARTTSAEDYQTTYIPIKVDSKAPTMQVTINKDAHTASVELSDENAIWHVGATLDGNKLETVRLDDKHWEVRGVNPSTLSEGTLRIEAMDCAGNPAKPFETSVSKAHFRLTNLSDVQQGKTNKLHLTVDKDIKKIEVTDADGTQITTSQTADGSFTVDLSALTPGSPKISLKLYDADDHVVHSDSFVVPHHAHAHDEDDDLEDEDDDTSDDESDKFESANDVAISNGMVIDKYRAGLGNGVHVDDNDPTKLWYDTGVNIGKNQRAEMNNVNVHYNKTHNISDRYKPLSSLDLRRGDDSDSAHVSGQLHLADGTNSINVKVYETDAQGKEHLIFDKGFHLFVDTELPQVKFDDTNLVFLDDDDDDYFAEAYTNTSKLELKGHINDNLDGWQLEINGNEVDSWHRLGQFGEQGKAFTHILDAQPEDIIHVSAKDTAGNTMWLKLKVKLDQEAPKVVLEAADGGELTPDSKLKTEFSDNNDNSQLETSIKVNGKTYLSDTPLSDYRTAPGDDNFYIQAVARDKAGNVTEKTAQVGNAPAANFDDVKLIKNAFDVSELTDPAKMLQLPDGVQASFVGDVDTSKPDTTVYIKLVDKYGHETTKPFAIHILQDSELAHDSSLKAPLKKKAYLPSELSSISDLIDLPAGMGATLVQKLEIAQPGNKKLKVRLYQAGNAGGRGSYNEVEYEVRILPQLDARLKKTSFYANELTGVEALLELTEGHHAELLEALDTTPGEKVIKVRISDDFGHTRDMEFAINVLATPNSPHSHHNAPFTRGNTAGGTSNNHGTYGVRSGHMLPKTGDASLSALPVTFGICCVLTAVAVKVRRMRS